MENRREIEGKSSKYQKNDFYDFAKTL